MRGAFWDQLQHGVSTLKASAPDPSAIDELTPAAVFQAMAEQAASTRQELREAEIRRMLGCWVSELQPVFVMRHDGRLAGLSFDGAINADGTQRLFVLSQYVDPSDPYGSRGAIDAEPRWYGFGPDLAWYRPGDTIELDITP